MTYTQDPQLQQEVLSWLIKESRRPVTPKNGNVKTPRNQDISKLHRRIHDIVQECDTQARAVLPSEEIPLLM